MKLLEKENWWLWLLMLMFSGGSSIIVLGALLDLFDKNAWYAKWQNWVIGLVLIIPFTIMVYIFNVSMTCKTAAKLGVKGSEYYLSPYIWLILIIIPFIGWLAFIILYLYLNIVILIKLSKGIAKNI